MCWSGVQRELRISVGHERRPSCPEPERRSASTAPEILHPRKPRGTTLRTRIDHTYRARLHGLDPAEFQNAPLQALRAVCMKVPAVKQRGHAHAHDDTG